MIKSKKMLALIGVLFVLITASSTTFASTFGIQLGDYPAWWSDPGVVYYDAEPNLFDASQTYSLGNALDTKVFVAFYYTRTVPTTNIWGLRFESGFDWSGTVPSFTYDGNFGPDQLYYDAEEQEYGYVWRSIEMTGDPGDLIVIMKNLPDYLNSVISEYHIAILQTPVPIPGAVWLFGSGLIGLAGMRKRFTKQVSSVQV